MQVEVSEKGRLLVDGALSNTSIHHVKGRGQCVIHGGPRTNGEYVEIIRSGSNSYTVEHLCMNCLSLLNGMHSAAVEKTSDERLKEFFERNV